MPIFNVNVCRSGQRKKNKAILTALTGQKILRYTLEYMGDEKQITEDSNFVVIFVLSPTKFLTSTVHHLKQFLSYFMHRTISNSLHVCHQAP